MKNSLNKIFKKDKNIIIGAIHFPPLFGYKDFPGLNIALKIAQKDLKAFEEGGVDGIIIENNYDIPHKIIVDKETTDMMIFLGEQIKKNTNVPIGVSVLWNDYKSALFIAKKIGAEFVRIPVFVDNVKTNYGEVFGNPKDVLGYRKKINAEDVAIFTDIHVKHAELLNNKSIEESALEAIKFNSNTLIITGKWTGNAPDLNELERVRSVVDNFPIIVGSGANKNNIKKLLEYANGAIVSTSLKVGTHQRGEVNIKNWKKRIDVEKVKFFLKEINNY